MFVALFCTVAANLTFSKAITVSNYVVLQDMNIPQHNEHGPIKWSFWWKDASMRKRNNFTFMNKIYDKVVELDDRSQTLLPKSNKCK